MPQDSVQQRRKRAFSVKKFALVGACAGACVCLPQLRSARFR
jgi:hypothetical protein